MTDDRTRRSQPPVSVAEETMNKDVLGASEAVEQAFAAQQSGGDLVKRLLSVKANPSPDGLVIVIFTGYGLLQLANHARDVGKKLANPPIYIVGPDNLCTAQVAEQNWDAVTYATYVRSEDKKGEIKREVIADAFKETQYTSGQATVTARWIEERGFRTAILVTAAYHQPRAYMTLLKSLLKRGIDDRVQLIPRPYRLNGDRWNEADQDLKEQKPWASAFLEDELPRIIEYQRKGDVASWEELGSYLSVKRSKVVQRF